MSGVAGEGCEILVPFNERRPLAEIERSLVKTYRKQVWSKFIKAIKDYKLVEEGDKIAIAISDIPVHIYDSGIFQVVDKIAKDYPCYMCARMRRGSLYGKAKELGCNKLALGHHFNDVIETTMLNVLYAGNFKTMLPKLKAANFDGIELIRPLYYIEEKYIKRWIQRAGIWPLNCACMVAAKKIGNKRFEIKDMIEEFKEKFDGVDKSIFRAAQNVSVDSILGWDIDGEHYSYLDFYDEESLLNSTAELKQKGLVNEAVAYERQNIARNLIGLLDDEVIAEKTGLSLKEIKSMQIDN